MLQTVNTRALIVSRCSSRLNSPLKRLASLTGAIQKGARRSKSAAERRGQYDQRPDHKFGRSRENGSTNGSGFRKIERQDERRQDFLAPRPRYSNDRRDQYGLDQRSNGRHQGNDERGRRRLELISNKQSSPRPQAGRGTLLDPDRSDPPPRQRQVRSDDRKFNSDRRHQREHTYGQRDTRDGRWTRQPAESRSATLGQGARPPRPDWQGSVRRGQGDMTAIEQSGEERVNRERYGGGPMLIPRSTAASEFIYGTSAVMAALQARRRKLYKLYIQFGPDGAEKGEKDDTISQLATSESRLKVVRNGAGQGRLMDAMSQGRPHNGYVLEASTLPMTPTEALGKVTNPGEDFPVEIEHQSAEELAVNGRSNHILTSSRRYPFVLMLDSIVDSGNLGAVIRTAAFFGVDAVAVVDYNLAPFSPVTLKASAGSAEYMQFLRIRKDLDWVKRSQSNGWKFFAAVPPDGASGARSDIADKVTSGEAEEALAAGPCVLVVGGEGEGLRPRLQKAADATVAIKGGDNVDTSMGLDSLNVSVAAALLMQSFVKRFNSPGDGLAPILKGDKERLF